MSTPVVIDHHAYLHLGNGRLCCLDLKSGKQVWRSKPFGEYWSMVANGDRILALDERGELLLIAVDAEQFRLLDRKEIADSESWAHLAVCGNELFVRDLKGISAFLWK
jgi:outer membrane protein assembly factor BamB